MMQYGSKSKSLKKRSKFNSMLLLAVLVVPMVLMLLTGCGTGATSDKNVYSKLCKWIPEKEYEKVEKLLSSNPEYSVTDKAQAETLLACIKESKLNYSYWLPVVDHIQCTDGEVRETIDGRLNGTAMNYFLDDFDLEKAADIWDRCSEGSRGNLLYRGFTEIVQGDPKVGAALMADALKADDPTKERIQYGYHDYLDDLSFDDVQNYMDHMMALAILFSEDHAASIDTFTMPNDYCTPWDRLHETQYGDISVYRSILVNDNLAATLPGALANSHGDKVLVLDRVLIAGTEEVKLGINSFVMRRLPEKYLPDTLTEVGYVILVDYGLDQNDKWYAGTATITAYEVATGKEIYVSETLMGKHDTMYVGKPTNVIFGSYPDITQTIKEAMYAIAK